MKPLFDGTRQLLKWFTLFCLLFLLAQGCAKYKEFQAVFPAKNNALSNYRKIEVVRRSADDFASLLMENALKAQLTLIHAGNVKPEKGIDQIDKEIDLFNYHPKLDLQADQKTAKLSFTLKVAENTRRDRDVTHVPLQSCNYLNKKNPCRFSGTGTLNKGRQNIMLRLSGVISLKDNTGRSIIPDMPFNKTLSDDGQFVESPGILLHKGINQVASEYARQIIPHKENIKTEILKGGDDISVQLIEFNALNLAVNRLDRIVSREDEPDVEDLYNLGLAYEILNELNQALSYYQKAADADPDEEVIVIALRRIRRIVKE